ncbi:MAG: SIR2 family NAD-dependent protein deacylase [Terriglobales bacterium]
MQQIVIHPADRVFVLTGAGVSAESGIPTFRGAGGLWRGYRFEEVASPQAWAADPKVVWDFYSMRRKVAAAAKPNPAHVAIAQLEEQLGDRFVLVTQNVDNLHEQAGSKRVIHMHGELFKSRCERCDRASFSDEKLYEQPTQIPRCECGGRIRPHICWFGEMPHEMDRIYDELTRCTLFACVGTSGVVYPAAGFVSAVWGRAKTFYVGPEAPDNIDVFDTVLEGQAGEVLPRAFVVL